MLISAGANCYAQNKKGNTPAHVALHEQNVELFNEMMEFSDIIKVVKNNSGDTLLHAAIRGCLTPTDLQKVVNILVKRNPDLLEYRNKRGFSPIMAACVTRQSVHLEIFANAHQNGLQMRSSNEKYTLLHIAVLFNNVDAIKWLLTRNEQDTLFFQYSVDYHGHTPLHLVRRVECAEALHSNGYDMNVQDSNGNTLLHTLVKGTFSSENEELLQFVLVNSDTSLKNTAGLTALHLAWNSKKYEFVQFMIATKEIPLGISDFNSDGDSLLHVCLQQENEVNKEIVKQLAKHPQYLQCQNKNCDTPLHIAAQQSSLKVLSLFSDFSGPYNSSGMNPFQVAVSCRSADILTHIHDTCTPDLHSRTQQGESLLHLAAAQNCLEVVKFLCKYIDANVTNSSLEIPLHSAIKASNYEVVEYLLLHEKCNPCLLDIHGRSPIHISAYLMDLKSLAIIFSGHPHLINLSCTINGDTVLHLAAQSNNVPMLKHYIHQVGINCINNKLETPLFTAIVNDCAQATKYLLHWKGCQINIRNIDGESPLQIALKRENWDVLQALLEFGECDFEIKPMKNGSQLMPLNYVTKLSNSEISRLIISTFSTNTGSTLLHLASQYNVTDIFSYVLFPTQINCLDNEGNTPLHIAIMWCNEESLHSILQLPKLNLSIRNKNNLSAFDIAVSKGCVKLVEPLWNTGKVNPFSALKAFVAKGNSEVLKYFLSKNIDVNMENDNGDTLLHLAILQKNLDAVKLMLKEKNCSLCQANKQGNTPLHLTCSLDCKETSLDIAKILLKTEKSKEIEPNCINRAGKTPAQLATENYGVLHQLSNFLDITTHNKLENLVKVIVVGRPGVGKSHLIEAIATDAKDNFMTRRTKVQQASRRTAGIVSRQIRNKHFGSAVLHEFAGHPEYYDCNVAILNDLTESSPPLFLVVISLNSESSIIEEVCYWLKFIDHHCAICVRKYNTSPHVIFALSFYDMFKKSGQNFTELLAKVKRKIATQFPNPKYEFNEESIVALDCRMLSSPGLKQLNGCLSQTCQILRVEENDDFMCTYFNAFLKDKFKGRLALQVKDIEGVLNEDNFLNQDTYEIMRLLSTLHDKDQILLLRNSNEPRESWIVFDKNALISEIQGSIFCPEEFENHFDLAESTGVVHMSKIKECFRNYDPYMIAGVLCHLEYCSPIKDPKVYVVITKKHPVLREKEYYFFPSLVKTSAPPGHEIWTEVEQLPVYGILFESSSNSSELYLNRVMHVLILRLAFSFALGSKTDPATSPVLCLRCSVWKNGIAWLKLGMQVIIEFSLQFNRISVILKLRDKSVELKIQATRLMSELSMVIREALDEFCPSQTLSEYALAPECIDYPMLAKLEKYYNDVIKFSVEDIVCSLCNNIPTSGYVECSSGKNSKKISSVLPFELFLNSSYCVIEQVIHPSSSRGNSKIITDIEKQLLSDNKLDKEQMKRIEVFFCIFDKALPHTKSLSMLKKFSVLSRTLPNKKIKFSQRKRPSSLCSSNISISFTKVLESHAYILQHELRNTTADWQNIGVLCGVPISSLKDIVLKFERDPVAAMNTMIVSFIQHCYSPYWETIISAVRHVGYEVVAQKLESTKLSLDNCETLSEQCFADELSTAFKKLYPLASHWKSIGIELGLESHVLERIMSDYSRSVDCLRETLYSCYNAGRPLLNDNITRKDFIDF